MLKIKNLEISGIRGIKNLLSADLDRGKSLLIYGENGSGKSSIADAIEWFYYDRVEHLSSEEIGRKGIEALRNLFLTDTQDAYIDIKFTSPEYDVRKKLFVKRSKLTNEYSNSSEKFNDYIKSSLNENLILRYKDLLRFILSTKSEKLQEISQIIGYSEVIKTKNVLKKVLGDLKKIIRIKNFDNQINQKQSQILEQINQPIHNDEQYFAAIKKLIAPLKLPVEIKDNESINIVLKQIEQTEDKEAIALKISYEKVIQTLKNIKSNFKNIFNAYKNFHAKYQKLLKEEELFKKIALEKLISEGFSLLEKNVFIEDKCPLCLQSKKREELINDLRKRIEELKSFKKEKEELEQEKENTIRLIQDLISEVGSLTKEKCLTISENIKIKNEVENIKVFFLEPLDQLKHFSLIEKKEIITSKKLSSFNISNTEKIVICFEDKLKIINLKQKDNIKFNIASKILLVRQSYSEIISLKKELDIINNQLNSMEIILSQFIKKQKESLDSFLKAISSDINNYYLFMNPDEYIDAIELIPLGEGDELDGLTIQYKFHGNIISPPGKYLSESHLNCLGICLFLSSVQAFNKKNNFFILDDVISSFDTPHRAKFANLLTENFSEYQIFLFTHEWDWFEYLANIVKGKNWNIRKVFMTFEQGVEIEIPLITLKERIENKFRKSDSSDLGNMLRKYLERLLKEICFNLKVEVEFRYNNKNEKRTAYELYCKLQNKLKKFNCELEKDNVFKRIQNSGYFGNITSHDSKYSENINDLKSFYNDILSLELFFLCNKCNKFLSLKNYNKDKKMIKCSCNNLKYNWFL